MIPTPSVSFTSDIAFITCAMLGGIMHYTKKFLRKETTVTMTQWFGKANAAASFYTLVMFMFVMVGALAGGIINESTDFWTVLYTGFITGFAVDSGFNSDKDITQQLADVKSGTKAYFKQEDEPAKAVDDAVNKDVPVVADVPADEPKEEAPEAPPVLVSRPRRPSGPVPGSPRVPPQHIS
jgi:hypothetical protein